MNANESPNCVAVESELLPRKYRYSPLPPGRFQPFNAARLIRMVALLEHFNADAQELDFAACSLGDRDTEILKDAISAIKTLLAPGEMGHGS